ncbi:MAG: NADH-quinone oxidoreductase subunit L, partial [Fimbriimonadaceae bacterium]|nr:NADH-quinone oxidoreductase subunit L [Fimbriimonadaceae bacterium]
MDLSSFNMIWAVFLLPLAGALFQALGGKIVTEALGPKLGRQVAGWIGVAPIALAFLIAVPMFLSLTQMPPDQRAVIVTLFDWIDLQTLKIPFEFRVDPLSMTMVLIITGIGSLIHMYAVGYMAEEKDFTRFFSYLNLFIALMLVLVLGNNLALLFIGWEGVGLCSYLLIGFWYKDLANSRAANKAFIANRVGDVGLTLGMFFIIVTAALNRGEMGISDSRWLSYDVLLPKLAEFLVGHPVLATTIALLLFVGAMGKSAQFPLYVWLPDAMAGPTPVSALIHAATMVTSGVVLLNRMQEVFLTSPAAMGVVALVGAVTALLGALIAFGQTDIKKVLAYSTVSQLGYMFIACGVGAFYAGMFHVITHAFFKALLFLGSGAVIHAMAHNQDMRNYGRLMKYIPITAWTMIIGWAAIAGIPFVFSGFWSKEAILGSALGVEPMLAFGIPVNVIAGWTGLIVAGMTAWYMTRMMVLTFGTNEERWRLLPAHGHHDDHHEHGHGHHDDDHGHAHADPENFFLSVEEIEIRESLAHEHHHDLDEHHEPKEVPW